MIFLCLAILAVDGDTLVCQDGQHVRLAGVDAPELPGHCRRGRRCAEGDPFASWAALSLIATGQTFTCTMTGRTWDRIAAWCEAVGGQPLSCAMLDTGQVVRWDIYWPKGRDCGELGRVVASAGAASSPRAP